MILSHDWEAWRSHEIAQRMRQSLHMWSSIEEDVFCFIKNFGYHYTTQRLT